MPNKKRQRSGGVVSGTTSFWRGNKNRGRGGRFRQKAPSYHKVAESGDLKGQNPHNGKKKTKKNTQGGGNPVNSKERLDKIMRTRATQAVM